MKKAVIRTGSKQYIVSVGDIIDVEKLIVDKKVDLETLMLIDNDDVKIGKPVLSDVKVTAEVIAPDKLDDKVTSIRYKAKKRVHTVRGHRQHRTVLKIVSIK